MLSSDRPSFVLRIGSSAESSLYTRRWLYVGLRRNWRQGSRVLFVRKSEAFTGSGVVAKVQPLEELDDEERELCLKQNMYAKIQFGSLERFLPPVPMESTPDVSVAPLALHGAELPSSVASDIESLAASRIIL